jgi:hypothetical protein
MAVDELLSCEFRGAVSLHNIASGGNYGRTCLEISGNRNKDELMFI